MIGCDDDLSTVGGQVIDTIPGNGFTKENIAVTAYNEVIASVESNRLPGVLLGKNQDDVFGTQTFNVLSQVGLTAYGLPAVDATAVLNSVVITIPYYSSITGVGRDDDQEITTTYRLDSVRNPNGKINLSLIPSNFFLGNVDETNLENTKRYFNDEFDDGTGAIAIPSLGTPLFSKEIKLSSDELITTTETPEGCENGNTTKGAPAIRVILTQKDDAEALDFFNTNIIQKLGSAELSNENSFQAFFKGFYLKADPSTTDALAYLTLNQADPNVQNRNQASIILNYTETNESEEDNCLKLVKKNLRLDFKGNVLNLVEGNLKSDVIADIQKQKQDAGSAKIYLKGGPGVIGVIKLFSETPEVLDELRNNNSILNDALLRFYLDKKMNVAQLSEDALKALISQRIFIYNYETGEPLADFRATPQINTSNPETSNSNHLGLLQKEGDDYFFDVKITQHVKNLIYNNENKENPLLAICVTANVELPLIQTQDGFIVNRNNIKTIDNKTNGSTKIPVGSIIDPDGLVLVGNNTTDAKKLKLVLTYTQPIN